MNEGFLPPWIQPADEVGHLAQGYQVGMALGARQAEQAFREQQMMRQQQLDAQQKAQWEAEFGLQSAAAARKTAAIQAYQSDIAGGMDPIQAIIKHGPSIGSQGVVEAAALRSQQQRQKQVLPPALQSFDLPGGGKVNVIRDQMTGSFKLVPTDKPLKGESPEIKAKRHTIDAQRKAWQAKLTNQTLFDREVEETKKYLQSTGGKEPDDATLKTSVMNNINSIIEGLDKQYDALDQGGTTPSIPSTSKSGLRVLSISPAQ